MRQIYPQSESVDLNTWFIHDFYTKLVNAALSSTFIVYPHRHWSGLFFHIFWRLVIHIRLFVLPDFYFSNRQTHTKLYCSISAMVVCTCARPCPTPDFCKKYRFTNPHATPNFVRQQKQTSRTFLPHDDSKFRVLLCSRCVKPHVHIAPVTEHSSARHSDFIFN